MINILLISLFVNDIGQILNKQNSAISVLDNSYMQLTIKNGDKNYRIPSTFLLRFFISSVRFENCNISAVCLDSLCMLPHLRSLTIKLPKNQQIDTSILRSIVTLKYVSCNLNNECIVLGLGKIPQLEMFALAGQVNGKTLDDLVKNEIPIELRKVMISCKGDKSKIGAYVRKLTNISELWLYGDSITDDTIAAITAIKSIELLDISDACVTGETIPSFSEAKKLRISDCNITTKGIEKIAQIDSLEQLQLKNSGSFSVDKLARLSRLKRLIISDSRVKSITALFATPSLEVIHAVGCPLDEQSLKPPDKVTLIR